MTLYTHFRVRFSSVFRQDLEKKYVELVHFPCQANLGRQLSQGIIRCKHTRTISDFYRHWLIPVSVPGGALSLDKQELGRPWPGNLSTYSALCWVCDIYSSTAECHLVSHRSTINCKIFLFRFPWWHSSQKILIPSSGVSRSRVICSGRHFDDIRTEDLPAGFYFWSCQR